MACLSARAGVLQELELGDVPVPRKSRPARNHRTRPVHKYKTDFDTSHCPKLQRWNMFDFSEDFALRLHTPGRWLGGFPPVEAELEDVLKKTLWPHNREKVECAHLSSET